MFVLQLEIPLCFLLLIQCLSVTMTHLSPECLMEGEIDGRATPSHCPSQGYLQSVNGWLSQRCEWAHLSPASMKLAALSLSLGGCYTTLSQQ